MKPKMIGKITVDLGMTILLMLLMAFELIGRTAHEWIGAGMFVLFIFHHRPDELVQAMRSAFADWDTAQV